MKILFQGDSITDCGWGREDGTLGNGYAVMAAGRLEFEEPGKHICLNRGVSGNRIVDIYARAKSDIWNLKPDYMSLLVGVNDVWHELEDEHNGVDAQRFDRIYRMLLDDTLERLPALQIVLMEPYVMRGISTVKNNWWDTFYCEVTKRSQVVRKIAEDYRLPMIPLWDLLNDACKLAPADFWLRDGVHPTEAGHALIADAWLKMYHQLTDDRKQGQL